MRRTLLLTAAILTAGSLLVAGCGDDDDVATEPGSGAPSTAPTSDPAGEGVDHPTGSDEVVLSYVVDGGFVPVGVAFASVPMIVVTGDGTVYSQGPQTLQYPGPLVPNVLTRRLDEAGLAALLAAAEDAGLVGRDTSSSPDNIADAPTTTVTINAGGGSWEHRHYALGLDDAAAEADPNRAAVAEFTGRLGDLAGLVGAAHIGAETPADIDRFAVTALDAASAGDPELPQEPVAWPADGPDLASVVQGCAEVQGAEWAELFTQVNQLTPFTTPAGDAYIVSVRPLYPGVPGCS